MPDVTNGSASLPDPASLPASAPEGTPQPGPTGHVTPPAPDAARPAAQAAAPVAPPAGAPRPAGAYRIWAVNAVGQLPPPEPEAGRPAGVSLDPADPRALDFYYSLVDFSTVPPREQMALQADIDKVLRVIQRLYPDGSAQRAGLFRTYYVRLFNLARVGLVGPDAAPDIAGLELAKLTADLLDDEGGHVKNAYLRVLGKYAALYSLPFLAVYVLVSLLPAGLTDVLGLLQVDPRWLCCFCLLWIGCFHGVWLSYGIRKTKIALADLIIGEEDRMLPQIRLLFAGSLACAIGLLFALRIIDVQLGGLSLADITRSPTMAFLVGLLLGVAELALPASLGNRAGALAAAVK